MFKIIVLFFLLFSDIYALQSQERLKAVIIGKVAKYVTWQDKKDGDFTILVLNSKDQKLFKKIYQNKKIKKRSVKVKYITNIDNLENADMLYLSPEDAQNLPKILDKIKDKNIFTVSDIRGFAEKGGIMQVYFVLQKVKLRINISTAKQKHFKIKSSLLRIADIIREEYIDEKTL